MLGAGLGLRACCGEGTQRLVTDAPLGAGARLPFTPQVV